MPNKTGAGSIMGIKNVCRFIIAGFAAFTFLNILCFVYYNMPVHITSKTGATDYVWEQHAYYSKMTEGFGYGKMNNEGFNNLHDYNAQPINVLLMGSSQMEGTNVPQNKTTAALLNLAFNKSKYVYNIGISGHDFPHIINNLERSVQFYKPREYVVIEIGSIRSNIQELELGLNSSLEKIPSYDSKLMFYLQKIPYLRLLYSQYKSLAGKGNGMDISDKKVSSDERQYSEVLFSVMEKMSQTAMAYNVKIIIFYHPRFKLNYDGSISENTDDKYLKIFENACKFENIFFVNLADDFSENYETNYLLPHGFLNTAVGEGHLNRHGHQVIAGALVKKINQIEMDGSN
jgi:hypothetical protein